VAALFSLMAPSLPFDHTPDNLLMIPNVQPVKDLCHWASKACLEMPSSASVAIWSCASAETPSRASVAIWSGATLEMPTEPSLPSKPSLELYSVASRSKP
jgi:hypothetical protein